MSEAEDILDANDTTIKQIEEDLKDIHKVINEIQYKNNMLKRKSSQLTTLKMSLEHKIRNLKEAIEWIY